MILNTNYKPINIQTAKSLTNQAILFSIYLMQT